ncbi:hypothetical protein ACJJID_00175 (plasmid) [Microbulbifer sp. CnH-101-G]|uniref:hypothetical protein n=1 Tax=Microbulbifer sp. CnH-101-G TaxID=3243393 RepID=UPI004039A5F5
MSNKTLFQRALGRLQHLVSMVTGCRYRWQVRIVYQKNEYDLFSAEGSIHTTRRSGIYEERQIIECLNWQDTVEEQVKKRPGWGGGEVRVTPLAYLGWF